MPITFALDRSPDRFDFFCCGGPEPSAFCLCSGHELLRLALMALAFFLEPDDVTGSSRLQLRYLLRCDRAEPGYLGVHVDDRGEALALRRSPRDAYEQTDQRAGQRNSQSDDSEHHLRLR